MKQNALRLQSINTKASMNFHSKCEELKHIIYDTLPPLIGRECVFLDLPYYENIGDVLIWEGTEFFLRDNQIKCKYRASKDTFTYRPLPVDVSIILQGGGNFGDIWSSHQEFRLQVISLYPDNPIIILPQTVYYANEDNLKRDAHLMSMHKNLTICARDKDSEFILKSHFLNKVICLPDMAFCIDPSYLRKLSVKVNPARNLFVKRCDQEMANYYYWNYIQHEIEQHDWPTCEESIKSITRYRYLLERKDKLNKLHVGWMIDCYARTIMKKEIVSIGVRFLSKYNYIYTTRLHAAILATLLGKPYTIFDNSYGKNSRFFDCWLSDLEGSAFVRR